MADWQDLDMDEIAEWPLVPQILVVLILALIIQGFGYFFYLKPHQEHLEELVLKERDLKMQFEIKARKAAALPQVKSQLEELKARYQVLLQQLPERTELATMLASVNELGLDNGLSFASIEWDERKEHEFLYELPLNFELTGTYHDIGRFSQDIAKLPRIITFKDVTWQRVSQESSKLHFRVTANTYQFRPDYDPNEEKKDAK